MTLPGCLLSAPLYAKYAGMMQGKRFLKLLCHFLSPVHQVYIQQIETGKERKQNHWNLSIPDFYSLAFCGDKREVKGTGLFHWQKKSFWLKNVL